MRLIAAAVLILGPWTDEPEELDGWDVERFQQIADADGTPYVDHEVEYPPLTVIVAEVVLADDLVASHQRLVALSLIIDLAVAGVLARAFGVRSSVAYLLIGLPLVPSGLLRLDLWAALAAVVAAAALVGRRQDLARVESSDDGTRWATGAMFAVTVTVGAMIKLWPALLVAAAVGVKREREAALATGLGLLAGVGWLAISGTSAVAQITSLRGVTGWHIESIPGSIIALTSAERPRLEADAFRIGALDDTLVMAGRVVTIILVVAAAAMARRSVRQPAERLALVMLISVAALIVTAPLLSPQFLLWLTPWAAIAHHRRALLGVTVAAIISTAVVLAVFGPPDLDHPVAAVGLLGRDALLISVIVQGFSALKGSDRFEHP